ncbi:preprotein translocase subunit YajC [uncultured Allofournierella sp.]|uniref:preprotein translocase subunit YajC n=1 Tax=uncultured Allofournierella sp. TaxID=1940258 RepID=UPI0037505118
MFVNFLSTSTDVAAIGSTFGPLVMLAVMFLFMWLFVYRPQKKQQQKETEMRNSLEIGDEVTTIGGIIGRVVAIKEDTFVLETGSDRTKIRFRRAAIQSIEKLNLDSSAASQK